MSNESRLRAEHERDDVERRRGARADEEAGDPLCTQRKERFGHKERVDNTPPPKHAVWWSAPGRGCIIENTAPRAIPSTKPHPAPNAADDQCAKPGS